METTAPAPVTPSSHPKFVRWAVVLGIVIVLNAFLFVAANLVFAQPQYEAFCPAASKSLTARTEAQCIAQQGTWQAYAEPVTAGGDTGYCDFYTKCQQPWEDAMSAHALKFFGFMVIAGIIAIAAGVLLTGSSIVSSGLSYGGVLALIIGSVSYWGEADELVRLLISGAALIALLYLGWKKFRD